MCIRDRVESVYIEKPQLISMPAVSVKTVTYGNIEENTVVFAKERKSTIQVTTTTDKKTKEVKVLASKVLPVIYKPWAPIEPVVEVEYIPTVLIEELKQTSVEIKEVTKQIETVRGTVEQVAVIDLGDVKKYTSIVKTDTGKQQVVVTYDKVTQKVEKIQTTQVTEKKEKTYLKSTVNTFG